MITPARITRPFVLAVGLLTVRASPVVAQSSDGALANPPRFMQRDGEAIYRASCQACHMPAGQGAVGGLRDDRRCAHRE
jgi:mono/diheme cytochrome c family protein